MNDPLLDQEEDYYRPGDEFAQGTVSAGKTSMIRVDNSSSSMVSRQGFALESSNVILVFCDASRIRHIVLRIVCTTQLDILYLTLPIG